MPHYLVTGHLPDNLHPSTQSEETVRNIIQAQRRVGTCWRHQACRWCLSAPSQAKSLRARPNGEVLITDGPYLEAKEYVGGFTILEAADLDEALAWARKSVIACRMPVEVREIPYSNLPHGTPHPSRQLERKP